MPGKGKGKGMSDGQQKKKSKGKDNDSDSGSIGDAHSFDTLKDEGNHFVDRKQFDRAIEIYTQALDLRADDKNCLVSRSHCYLSMGKSDLALADAEKALEDDKEFNKGILCKAEALYHGSDFERALVFFHRGHKLRPEQQEFRLGIQKCQEAINNCVGTPETVKLSSKGDLASFYAGIPDDKPTKKKAPPARYKKPGERSVARKQKEKPKRSGSDKTIKQLLGDLFADRQYLEQIFDDEDKRKRSTKSSEIIQKLALDGINYLDSRTDFWRQQKPMYSRKRDKEMREREARGSSKSSRKDAARYVLKNLEEIDQAQTEGRYDDSLKQSKSVLKTVEKYSDDDIPNRDEVIANLHSCMGNAYLEKGEFEKSLNCHQKDLDIAEERDIGDAKSRAMDNLGRVYARMGKFEEAIEIWNKKVPDSKTALETTWLYHEIGRCHLELGQNDKAKDYGERSLAAAQEAEDDVWQLNASVLIAQAEVKSGDYQAAVDSFERSLEMAKAQGDTEAEKAIKKALEDVNDKIVKGLKGEDDGGSDKEKDDRDGDKQSDGEKDDAAPDEDDGYDQDFEDTKDGDTEKTDAPDEDTNNNQKPVEESQKTVDQNENESEQNVTEQQKQE